MFIGHPMQLYLRFLTMFILLLGMTCASNNSVASDRHMKSPDKRHKLITNSEPDRVQNEYLLSSKRMLSQEEIEKIFSKFPIRHVEEVRTRPPLYKIKFNDKPSENELKKIVESLDYLDYIEPNFIYRKS
jgi:hypothetical protein